MLPLTQQLRGWRHACSLHHYHCHHRLLTSSAPKFESWSRGDTGHSFGRLAASRQKNSAERESDTSTERFSKQYRGFPQPAQRSTNSWRDSPPPPPQNDVLAKWQQFKDTEYQETLSRWTKNQQDDAEVDYQYFMSRGAPGPQHQTRVLGEASGGKYSLKNAAQPLQEDITAVPGSEGTLENDAQKGGTFGSLSPRREENEGDEGDLREERYQSAKLERRHRPHFYGFKMKRLCKERKLREAIKILEEEMPAAGVKPDNFCFQVLINACGRAGYTKKAFSLYNQMKKRALKVEPVAYTGLFLACAHSPWPTTDGLQRATHLRSHLQEKGIHFNQIVSHAMIKAFGWCGDMATAFQVVDEMVQNRVMVTTETINFLLQACITNKEVGFRHAVKVWRKMRDLRLQPDIHSYNLLMRVVKDCSAGHPNLTLDLLRVEGDSHGQSNKDSRQRNPSLTPKILDVKAQSLDSTENLGNALGDTAVLCAETRVVESVEQSAGRGVLPDVLGKVMMAGDVVAVGALDKPADRLALLGGPRGILRQMKRDRVNADLKTVTQMLESLPSDTEAEQALLESMKNLKLEPDTQFFNMLIKKRNFRHDSEAAKEVVAQMQHYHLVPDLITYGCLALGCRDRHSATDLLKDMDAVNFRPNLEIMSSLVRNSLVRQDYGMTMSMLQEMKQRGISPNDSLLTTMEEARTKARGILLDEDSSEASEGKKRSAEVFLKAYKTWLKNSDVQLSEHPWTQYR